MKRRKLLGKILILEVTWSLMVDSKCLAEYGTSCTGELVGSFSLHVQALLKLTFCQVSEDRCAMAVGAALPEGGRNPRG